MIYENFYRVPRAVTSVNLQCKLTMGGASCKPTNCTTILKKSKTI